MANEYDPVVGRWYENIDNEEKFQVLSLDEDTGTVMVRYHDGGEEEIDIDIWYGLDIAPSSDPDGPEDLDDDDEWEDGFDDDDLPEDDEDEDEDDED